MQEFGEATAHKDKSKEEFKKENPKCKICEKVFVHNCYLNVHLKTVHGKQKPFPCGACSSSFGSKGNLNKHVQVIHTGLKPFKCQICLTSFCF
jgi:hypothetical protein